MRTLLCALLIAAAGVLRAQVPSALLPVLGPHGDYQRTPGQTVKVVEVSEGGITVECTRDLGEGAEPARWRERYAIRDGRLVLDTVFTPKMMPPEPTHADWEPAIKLGTSNIGPASLDPRWAEFRPYLQSLIEAVQNEWLFEIAAEKIRAPAGCSVTVTFILNKDGRVQDVVNVIPSRGTPYPATTPCVHAINVQAPFPPWTEDMVEAFGATEQVALSFFYP